MTGSWLCLPLLLVGALLLGQPAWGAEEEEEQPVLRASAELHASNEAEEQTVPPSTEGEGNLQEEEPTSDSLEDLDGWRPQNSDEEISMLLQMERRFMEEEAAHSAHPVHDFMKRKAVVHYNKHDWRSRYGNYYKPLESRHFDVEKAIGIIFTIKMTLAKTNCTRDDVSSHYDIGVRYTDPYLESQGCVLPPESEQEKLDCKFTIFLDEKHGGATVIDDFCRPVPGRTEQDPEEEEEEEAPEPSPEEDEDLAPL